MWRLAKTGNGEQLILVLSGHIANEQLAELRRTVEAEALPQKVTIDLENLRLVDQDVVAYLAQCDMRGVRIQNCPLYIREWITNSRRTPSICK
jgi:ABC-type transporter Mla MlaB component